MSESCSNPLLQLLRENRLDEARQSLSQATLIDLSHSALSDFEFHNLALVLQDTTSVVDLNLSHSVCTGKQLADLIFATAKNQTFSGLDVCECNLNDSDIECIAKALEFNETIQLLDLMSNSITDTGAKVLSEIIEYNYSLIRVTLSDNPCSQSPTGKAFVATIYSICQRNRNPDSTKSARQRGKPLDPLPRQAPIIPCNATSALLASLDSGESKSVQNLASIKGYLSLAACKLSPQAIETLTVDMKRNATVTELDLDSCPIAASEAALLIKSTRYNKVLKAVHLWYTEINDAGALQIAAALKRNKSLRTLNLSSNRIGVAGVYALSQAIKLNSTLTSLKLDFNPCMTLESCAAPLLAIDTVCKRNERAQQVALEVSPSNRQSDSVCTLH